MSVIAGVLSAVASLASQGLNKQYNDETRREQNIFNKYEAQRAREWNQQMDSTKYQRTVNDMQQAGVNPALAMNGGVTTQATSNAQAQSASQIPSNIDMTSAVQAALQAKQLQIQNKIAEAQANELNTRAEKNKAETKREDINNSFLSQYNELRNQGMQLTNDLTATQKESIVKSVEKMDSEIELLKKQAATEVERKNLTIAEAALKRSMQGKTEVEAMRLAELLPYEQELMSAQTENQKAQASMALVKAAYDRKLIDDGYIESMVAINEAGKSQREQESISAAIKNNISTGRWFTGNDIFSKAANTILGASTAIGHIVGNVIPIKGLAINTRRTSIDQSQIGDRNTEIMNNR